MSTDAPTDAPEDAVADGDRAADRPRLDVDTWRAAVREAGPPTTFGEVVATLARTGHVPDAPTARRVVEDALGDDGPLVEVDTDGRRFPLVVVAAERGESA